MISPVIGGPQVYGGRLQTNANPRIDGSRPSRHRSATAFPKGRAGRRRRSRLLRDRGPDLL